MEDQRLKPKLCKKCLRINPGERNKCLTCGTFLDDAPEINFESVFERDLWTEERGKRYTKFQRVKCFKCGSHNKTLYKVDRNKYICSQCREMEGIEHLGHS